MPSIDLGAHWSPMVAFCGMQNVIPSDLHQETHDPIQTFSNHWAFKTCHHYQCFVGVHHLWLAAMALICQLWPHGRDWCWCVLMSCLQESLTPCFVFEGSTWTGSACEECGVGRVVGWDGASVTSQGSCQSQGNNFRRLLEQFLASNLGEWPVPRTRPQHGFTLQLFVTRGFWHHLIFILSVCWGRLCVSNLTPPNLTTIMPLFVLLLFQQPKNTWHAASEVFQVLGSPWPLKKKPRPFPKNNCSIQKGQLL